MLTFIPPCFVPGQYLGPVFNFTTGLYLSMCLLLFRTVSIDVDLILSVGGSHVSLRLPW